MAAPITSLWASTASPAPAFPALAEATRADVLVIGGGFTGLSTALHLAEAGTSVALLEAATPGHGASGRNGGQVIPGLKHDPDQLDRDIGPHATEFAGKTADVTFDLIARLGIDCTPECTGWIQTGDKDALMPMLQSRMRQWQARGVKAEWLDIADMEQATGSPRFRGGWFDPRAGQIHPLNFAHGLARAAQSAGVALFADSPVESLTRQPDGWVAETPGGRVTADRVVLATNTYTPRGLWPNLAESLVPAQSFQIATAPLPDDLAASILPGHIPVSEARRVGTYFRIGPGKRLMIGGRGTFGDPSSPDDFTRIRAELAAIYPQAADLPLQHHWFGKVGMTADHMPRLAEPAPGLMMALGYNGRGVALGTAMGKALAEHLTRGAQLPLPLESRLRPLPLHRLHRIYGEVAIHWYRLRDRMD